MRCVQISSVLIISTTGLHCKYIFYPSIRPVPSRPYSPECAIIEYHQLIKWTGLDWAGPPSPPPHQQQHQPRREKNYTLPVIKQAVKRSLTWIIPIFRLALALSVVCGDWLRSFAILMLCKLQWSLGAISPSNRNSRFDLWGKCHGKELITI